MKKMIRELLQKKGYAIQKIDSAIQKEPDRYLDIANEEFWKIYELCNPYTMTGVERMYALFSAVEYILKNNIAGDFVECGVWRGGSSMLIAKMLINRNIFNRKIYMYDTYEGMSEPGRGDQDLKGNNASLLLKEGESNKEESVWCLASLEEVQNNLKRTGIADENIVYIRGKVEDTIPQQMPANKICLLRLDTDWYESTKHELEFLYPALELNGILIIDDYGHWKGCRQAVDEYFTEKKLSVLFNRIDYTGRLMIKSKMYDV